MSTDNQLTGQARERVGKGAARELRRNDMVPAVIYGDKQPPLAIALPRKEVTMKIHGGGFMTNILEIDVDGTTHKALPKDYQLHPVKDTPMHVDLLRVSSRTIVTVEIPVNFLNEETSVGLKAGGNLNVVRHTLEVNCRADSIPEQFDVDLAEVDIDDVVHASVIALPDGVSFVIDDRDFTICTIQPPKTISEEEESEEEGAPEAPETEVTGQKSEEDGEEGGE